MRKLPVLVLMLLVATTTLSAKDTFGAQDSTNEESVHEKQSKDEKVLWLAGTNLSNYLGEEGRWQLGYLFGLTFNFHVNEKVSITVPFSVTKINASPKNVEGRYYAKDGNIYKTYADWRMSVRFIEIPVLFSLNLNSAKKYDLDCLLGLGMVVATKGYDEPAKRESFMITNEIVDTHNFPPESLDPYDTRFFLVPPFAGVNVNTGIRFHKSWLYIDLLNTLYPFEIKEFKFLNAVSLRLGIVPP